METQPFQIQNAIDWNKQQIAKSNDARDIERYNENIKKLEQLLEDDGA